jgi:hypothetical protein
VTPLEALDMYIESLRDLLTIIHDADERVWYAARLREALQTRDYFINTGRQ